jgi:polyphosphate kinase
LDKALKRRVMAEGLNPYLKDNQNAWELEPDGHYQRRKARGKQALQRAAAPDGNAGTPNAHLGEKHGSDFMAPRRSAKMRAPA